MPAWSNRAQNLMQDRPKFQLVDIERIVGWILDDARDDLRGFDRDLPRWEAANPDEKSQGAADRQDPERLISMVFEEYREPHRSARRSHVGILRIAAHREWIIYSDGAVIKGEPGM